MQQNTSLIVTEIKTVWKGFTKICKTMKIINYQKKRNHAANL